MAKVGKFLLFTAAASAVAYGAFCYLRKKEVITTVNDDDDVVDFDEDLDGEPTKARSYVNLTFDKAKAEDLAKSAVKKAKETISGGVQKVEEFFNDEPKVVDIISDEATEAAEDITETVENTVL